MWRPRQDGDSVGVYSLSVYCVLSFCWVVVVWCPRQDGDSVSLFIVCLFFVWFPLGPRYVVA